MKAGEDILSTYCKITQTRFIISVLCAVLSAISWASTCIW